MRQEFEERKSRAVPDADPEERETVQFVKSWHRYPAFHEAIWYRGINLGEADEYILVSPTLTSQLRHAGKIRP